MCQLVYLFLKLGTSKDQKKKTDGDYNKRTKGTAFKGPYGKL